MSASPSQHWDFVYFGPVHGATVAVSLCVPDLLCNTLLPWNHLSPWLLQSFLLFLSAEVGGFDDFPFRTKCSEVSHSLVSTSSRLLQEEASLMVAEHQELFFCHDLLAEYLGFPLGPVSIWSQVIGHFGNVRHKFYLMKWASSPILQWLVTPAFVPLLHQHILQEVTIVGSWDGVFFLFWSQRVPSTMTISQ